MEANAVQRESMELREQQWKPMQTNGKLAGINAQYFWFNSNELIVINKVNWNRGEQMKINER